MRSLEKPHKDRPEMSRIARNSKESQKSKRPEMPRDFECMRPEMPGEWETLGEQKRHQKENRLEKSENA